MRRNRALEEKIAIALEDLDGHQAGDLEIPGHTLEEVRYHIALMLDDGMVEGTDVTSHGDRCRQAIAYDLTSRGHDLAERARARETTPPDDHVSSS